MNKMNKSEKVAVIALIVGAIAAVIVIAIGIGVKLAQEAKKVDTQAAGVIELSDIADTDADVTLYEYYCYGVTVNDEDTEFVMSFDAEAGTFVSYMGSDTLAEGDYVQEGNLVTITSYNDDGEVYGQQKFLIDGEYLLMEDAFYYGEIPDGETFEASAERTSSSNKLVTCTFYEDGTYILSQVSEDGDTSSAEGTYSRSGNLIERTVSDVETTPYYVYNGLLVVSFYSAYIVEE